MFDFNPDLGIVLLLAVRWTGYLGLVALVGVALFVSWVWPDGRSDMVLRRVLIVGGVLSAVSTLVLPLVTGLGGGSPAFAGREGSMIWLRLALFSLAAGFGGEVLKAARRHPVWVGLWCLAVLETYVIGSNAAAAPYAVAKIIATTGHLYAVAAWLGGLLALTAVLLPRTSLDILDQVIGRFSTVALTSVLILAVTGAVHAVATAGGVTQLVQSRYGAVLVVKVAAFAAMLVLGNEGRRYAVRVARRARNPDRPAGEPDIRVLAVSVGGEFALAVGVLAITAVLAQNAP